LVIAWQSFLIGIVYPFTLITMVGGNPKKDAYGVSLLAQITASYELTSIVPVVTVSTVFVMLAATTNLSSVVICITYLFFYRACKAQILDRRTMPYFARFQSWSTWIALVFLTCVVTCYGYPVFLPGRWSIVTFFTFYLMVLAAPVLFFGWKLFRKTKFIHPL
jgi:amino acid permease